MHTHTYTVFLTSTLHMLSVLEFANHRSYLVSIFVDKVLLGHNQRKSEQLQDLDKKKCCKVMV